MSQPNNRGNGNKTAITVVVGLLAVIAGVYSMVEPMGQRIDFLERELERSRTQLAAHAAITGHVAMVQRHAEAGERFKEVETQFSGLREVVGVRLDRLDKDRDTFAKWQNEHDLRVVGLNAAQWERIKALEREVYGKASVD
jgi:hypothetical protein